MLPLGPMTSLNHRPKHPHLTIIPPPLQLPHLLKIPPPVSHINDPISNRSLIEGLGGYLRASGGDQILGLDVDKVLHIDVHQCVYLLGLEIVAGGQRQDVVGKIGQFIVADVDTRYKLLSYCPFLGIIHKINIIGLILYNIHVVDHPHLPRRIFFTLIIIIVD